MTDDLIVLYLLKANVAASVAILLVLAVRLAVRDLIGATQAYWLWSLVPVAALTSLFPNLKAFAAVGTQPTFLVDDIIIPGANGLTIGFLVGAGLLLTLFLASEWRIRRLARLGRAGPAVIGISWPQVVVPADYETRFNPAERRLIGLHERTHIERDHPLHNRLIAAAQLLGWFNPLIHLAAHCARLDQEMACDAAVMEKASGSRRLYAETLLKAHASSPWSALACALAEGGRHPLEVRIRALRRQPISLRRYLLAAALVGALAAIMAVSIWTLSPQTYA